MIDAILKAGQRQGEWKQGALAAQRAQSAFSRTGKGYKTKNNSTGVGGKQKDV